MGRTASRESKGTIAEDHFKLVLFNCQITKLAWCHYTI